MHSRRSPDCDVDEIHIEAVPVRADGIAPAQRSPPDTGRCPQVSALTDYWDGSKSQFPARLRVGGAALAITVTAFLAGLVGIVLVGAVLRIGDLFTVPAVQVLRGNLIQIGFAAFAVTFLAWRGQFGRYCKLRRPTLEDLGWIVVIPLLFAAQGSLLSPVLAAVGLPHPHPSGGESVDLATRPLLWPVAFVGMYLFAAPAEELVYRGIVQGTLRRAFDTFGVVVLGGLAFGLMHVLVGLVTPSVGPGGALYWGMTTFVPGLIWGYAYERTENLTVTAVTHAMSWTVAIHEIGLELLQF